MKSMKIIQFSRPPPPLSIYVQYSTNPLTLDVKFQTNPPLLQVNKPKLLQVITNQLKKTI